MTCTDPVAVRAGLELGASELQVQRSYRSAGDAASSYLSFIHIYNSKLGLEFQIRPRSQKLGTLKY